MRSVAGTVAVAVLLAGPATLAVLPCRPAAAAASRGPLPKDWKKRTSLRILPQWPRQNDTVRVFVHCPTKANHALIGSTAFTLKGSWRIYREVGLGLSDRGLGRRGVGISYYAFPGDHLAHLKCVKVTINEHTRIRKVRVISRFTVPLVVRPFRLGRFF
ncbi:hypothetical protein [Nonomuraea roseoviolacea]|uniref:Secreted protein n=1 Tax=Nonomuraea roseoviolacea subsp. carminata TaxID=160689 RepID=A0ABT1JZR6_9ACTN|nr:hypothetical protein [Nonomuraea roseoviolacea]MCP2347246.1 hypothetical protein [Nonomuraea roseoviolacea subsp. carminata]